MAAGLLAAAALLATRASGVRAYCNDPLTNYGLNPDGTQSDATTSQKPDAVCTYALACCFQLCTSRPVFFGLRLLRESSTHSLLLQLALVSTRFSNAHVQACHWTADCNTGGCGNKCVANLLPGLYAGTAAGDAAYAADDFWAICPDVATLVYNLRHGNGASGRRLLSDSGMDLVQLPAVLTLSLLLMTSSCAHAFS